MLFRDSKWAEISYKTVRKETENLLTNIFGGYDKNKCYLFIKSSLFYKHIVNNIDGEITLFDKDNNLITSNEKYKIRQPYPNKNWYCNDMKYGRKILDDGGFVIKFDSFEELQKIKTINVKWNVISGYENGDRFNIHFHCKYNVSFDNSNSDNVFNIKSWDCLLIDETENFKEYEKQFDENDYKSDELGFDFLEYHEQNLKLMADNSRLDLV